MGAGGARDLTTDALRVGAFLSARLLPFYEAAALAAGAAVGREGELVLGAGFDLLAGGGLDAAILCGLPYVTLGDRAGLRVLAAPVADGARYGGRPIYFSEVIARAGEDATRLEDFSGRVLAVNEPDSHSGHGLVLATLARRGVPVGCFSDVVVTGGHSESIAAVRSGRADVAAIDSHLLALLGADDLGITAELTTVESLGPSPAQPFAAGPGLTGDEHLAIQAALCASDPIDGLCWAAVDDAAYDPIRSMRVAAAGRAGF